MTVAADLLELAWRAGATAKPRTRLVLCAIADKAASDTGAVKTSVADVAKAAGLPMHSTLRGLYQLERNGVLDVAFGETLAFGDEPDREQTFLLHVGVLRDRAGMRDRVAETVDALRTLGATVVQDEVA